MQSEPYESRTSIVEPSFATASNAFKKVLIPLDIAFDNIKIM